MKLIKCPIGIQTFEKIRKENYIYVDKTKFVYDLATRSQYYYLSRPRRFEKSLLLSTLEAFFKGRKELFKGLYAYGQEWDWVEYPVFHLALNGQNYSSVTNFDDTLNYYITEWAKAYNIPVDESIKTMEVRFANCIRRASENMGRPVVIFRQKEIQSLLNSNSTEPPKKPWRRFVKRVMQSPSRKTARKSSLSAQPSATRNATSTHG
ncbi:MAG: AAA family ATPase [Muribaculum sp.]|nr:AAA family ATPase [Muribaculum sp.]